MSGPTAKVGAKSPRIYSWRPWFPPKTFSKAMKGFFTTNVEEIMNDAERKLESYLDAKHVILMPSGTSAIFAPLVTLLPEGHGEVLLPSFICDVVPYAVKAAGKEPCFVEVDPQTFNIDDNLISDRVNAKTEAIIAVHQFGMPCNMVKISRTAEENNLLLIEDAAQALGAEYGGKKAGTLGDVGILSFNNKVVSACGGGAVVTDDEDYFRRLREYRDGHFAFRRKGFFSHLLRVWLSSGHPGWASALSRIYHPENAFAIDMDVNLVTPLLLQSVLPSLDSIVRKRRENFDLYNKYLEMCDVQRPIGSEGASCTFYTVKFKDAESNIRDRVQAMFRKYGIEAVVAASGTHNLFEPGISLPITENLSQTILSFPTDPHLGENEIAHISNILKESLKNFNLTSRRRPTPDKLPEPLL